MTGKELETLVQRLYDDGWKRSDMKIQSEDFHLYKGYEGYEDSYGETHYRYQILILFYDWRKYGERARRSGIEDEVSVLVIVMPIDLLTDERVELTLSRFDSITGTERIAKLYYEWVRKNFICKRR